MSHSIIRGLAVVLFGFALTVVQPAMAIAQGEDFSERPDVKDLATVPEYERRDDSLGGTLPNDVLEHRLGGCPEGPPCPSPSSSISQPSPPPPPENCGDGIPCPKDE
jgi:hypothetical protein